MFSYDLLATGHREAGCGAEALARQDGENYAQMRLSRQVIAGQDAGRGHYAPRAA